LPPRRIASTKVSAGIDGRRKPAPAVRWLLESALGFQYLFIMTSSDRSQSHRSLAISPPEDPLVRAARREAFWALGMWFVAMLYTITYCWLNGYGRSVESLTYVLWFPDWVFWGIVAPWGVCGILSAVFAFTIMGDQPLGDDTDADLAESADHERRRAVGGESELDHG
jgi:hypothetical protein